MLGLPVMSCSLELCALGYLRRLFVMLQFYFMVAPALSTLSLADEIVKNHEEAIQFKESDYNELLHFFLSFLFLLPTSTFVPTLFIIKSKGT